MCVSGHDSGPVFEEQPSSLIYPEGLMEGKVTLSCQARASPAASYRCLTNMTPTARSIVVESHVQELRRDPQTGAAKHLIFDPPAAGEAFEVEVTTIASGSSS